MGLIARAIEMAGIATVITSWNHATIRMVKPPRASLTRLSRGMTLGHVGDRAQQQRVLDATLALLELDGPLPPKTLTEK